MLGWRWGRFERVPVREVWRDEAAQPHAFRLEDNVDVSNDRSSHFNLSSVEREQVAGAFSVDPSPKTRRPDSRNPKTS